MIKLLLCSILCSILLAGCGPKAPPRPTETQMPAPKQPPPPPPEKPEALDPKLVSSARKELESALSSMDPLIHAHGIEAAQNTLKDQAKAEYLDGLKNHEPIVRFASAMAIGQLRIAEARPALERMINDPDSHVGIAVRFALHRLGDNRFTRDLQDFAKDPDASVRADTAMVLGLLKEPTAVRVLRPMQKDRESSVRLQVAEALWRLGDRKGLETLVAAAESMFADEQMFAVLALASPGDRAIMGHVRGTLTAEHEEVQIQAARAMGMLGSDAGYAIAAKGVQSKTARQRALAALAFGAIGRKDAQSYLRTLLEDEDADVRLCAAQAILQLGARR